jgi:hypothetical protein
MSGERTNTSVKLLMDLEKAVSKFEQYDIEKMATDGSFTIGYVDYRRAYENMIEINNKVKQFLNTTQQTN